MKTGKKEKRRRKRDNNSHPVSTLWLPSHPPKDEIKLHRKKVLLHSSRLLENGIFCYSIIFTFFLFSFLPFWLLLPFLHYLQFAIAVSIFFLYFLYVFFLGNSLLFSYMSFIVMSSSASKLLSV